MSAPALTPAAFIDHWSKAEANERANSQSFLLGLTQLLGVPQPSHNHADGYSFEYPVKVPGGSSTNFLDLDAAVFAAYGWPAASTDAEILERLVALNAQRAADEQRGIIHWLRPEYQNAKGTSPTQDTLELKPKPGQGVQGPEVKKAGTKTPWPKPLAERIRATEQALRAAGHAVTAEDLTQHFFRAKAADLQEILESLVTLGRARKDGERFAV